MSNTDVVRRCLESYIAQDRSTAEELIADDYTFTSPQNDRIDRATFFERCFPTADRFRSQRILDVVPVGSDGVFLLYEYQLKTGERYRNVELSTVRDGGSPRPRCSSEAASTPERSPLRTKSPKQAMARARQSA